MSFIRDIVKSLDQSEELQKEAAAHLDALEALANAKAELFEETLKMNLINAGTGTDRTIPITQIEDFTRDSRAYVASNASNITTVVDEAITGFVNGGKEQVVSGIEKLLTVAITALFGESTAGESTISKYYVANEGISLVRIDFMGWKRGVTSVSLTTKVEQVSAFVLCKSAVDINKTSFNAFLDCYQSVVLASTPGLTPKQIIEEAKELYDDFKSATLAKAG